MSERDRQPCAACKHLRRKCSSECIFAPHLPPDMLENFKNLHEVYGASNVLKLIRKLDPSKRGEAIRSLAYEATERLRNPVYGCAADILFLESRIQQLLAQIPVARQELSIYMPPPTAFQPTLPQQSYMTPPPPQQQQDEGGNRPSISNDVENFMNQQFLQQRYQHLIQAQQSAAILEQPGMLSTYEQQQQFLLHQQQQQQQRQYHLLLQQHQQQQFLEQQQQHQKQQSLEQHQQEDRQVLQEQQQRLPFFPLEPQWQDVQEGHQVFQQQQQQERQDLQEQQQGLPFSQQEQQQGLSFFPLGPQQGLPFSQQEQRRGLPFSSLEPQWQDAQEGHQRFQQQQQQDRQQQQGLPLSQLEQQGQQFFQVERQRQERQEQDYLSPDIGCEGGGSATSTGVAVELSLRPPHPQDSQLQQEKSENEEAMEF
ncbi:putative mediator of RNA polymerase II transcription subunit 12 [Ricinus communis]|uniref:LOB domain-containing protein n=1 Tax=Ricinus communis TaxID=3988 RepID=B9S8K7_RICCO|nr:putative mediator of RNA polymerase II transcription subunit 12 [Ricinus communis]EEF40010.1 hypothetical protein RCOM_0602130 [Ricinus communis]